MKLEEIIRGIAITDRRGRFDAEVTGITSDSRRVKPGDLFVAVRGTTRDGHDYIHQAVKAGAAGVIAETWPDGEDQSTKSNAILVPNSRRALALIAANFYGQPSRKLLLAGVTGTNGKTTITYVLESIIKAASKSVGVIGTVECRFDGKSFDLGNTTPDAVVLQQKLAEMLKAGVTHVVMEVSSHALDQQRVTGVHFKVAGFTNLTHDHLDYHKSLDTYFEAKARLFSETLRKSRARGRMAVVNVDDSKGPAILERWGGKSLSVSLDAKSTADVCALSAEYSLEGTKATVRTSKGIWDIETQLIGPHNLSNVLVSVGMALAMGFSKARIMRGLRALERVPGRLERVPGDPQKHVYVDYAHTPDALKRILTALRPLTKGRLICVFGCGGDRDPTKRAPMGRAVAEVADLAVVTNDNPRSENPASIALAIKQGLEEGGFSEMTGAPAAKTFKVELERRSAIRYAIDWAGANDVVVIAGKGHETYQIIGNKKHRFDDREEARRIMSGMPPPPPLTFDDGTSEVDTEQVVETLEIVDAAAIIAETSAPVTGHTDSVSAEAIVSTTDIEAAGMEVIDEADIEEINDEVKILDPSERKKTPAPVAPVSTVSPVAPVAPVSPVAQVSTASPVSPVAPATAWPVPDPPAPPAPAAQAESTTGTASDGPPGVPKT